MLLLLFFFCGGEGASKIVTKACKREVDFSPFTLNENTTDEIMLLNHSITFINGLSIIITENYDVLLTYYM